MDRELSMLLRAINHNLHSIGKSLEKLAENKRESEEEEDDSDGNCD